VAAKLKDIERVLADGGFVRFRWGVGHAELVGATGKTQTLDGRTYQGFLRKHQAGLNRVETGSTATKNLLIEWRQSEK
jgi:hypothetical protein